MLNKIYKSTQNLKKYSYYVIYKIINRINRIILILNPKKNIHEFNKFNFIFIWKTPICKDIL